MSFEYKVAPPRNKDAPRKRREQKKNEEVDLEKRESLKGIGRVLKTAALLGIGGAGIRGTLDSGKEEPEVYVTKIYETENDGIEKNNLNINIDALEKAEVEREDVEYEEGTEGKNMEEVESIADILDFSNEGAIRLTPEKIERVKNFWKERYGNKKDNLHKSLIDGYRNWGYWRKYNENRFDSVGIPSKFALLALPESHWKVDARSKSGAVGPYQFMPSTASSFNLRMDRIIDERRDPIKSSEACALVLKELYKASRDWDVAVSGYNGGFAWRFINEAKKNGQKTDYVNFLGYLEKKLNGIKNDLRSDKLQHIVRKRDNLDKIAAFYGISQREFRRANRMKSGIVFEGQEILIPTKGFSQEAKRKIFARTISGFSENLNYPAKFHAIDELIKDAEKRNQALEQYDQIIFSEIKIEGARDVTKKAEHIVAKGEWLSAIARNYGIKVTDLRKQNQDIKNMNDLKPGSRLMLPVKGRKKGTHLPSLVVEAKKRNQSLERIKLLNPKIINAWAPLPNGTTIRV